jgi:hypothetical protein
MGGFSRAARAAALGTSCSLRPWPVGWLWPGCSLWLGGWLWLGCAAPPSLDLSRNEHFYRDTGYRAMAPADRTAFVAPVADRRSPAVPASSGLPVQMLPDSGWEQPAPAMVDAIVRRELAASVVFAGLESAARPDACVVQVDLERFDAGVREAIDGRQSLAAVELRVRVLGPASASGQRPLLLEQPVGQEAQSDVVMRPPNARVLLGMTLRGVMAKVLASIDQSNAARSHVPLQIAEPAH